MVRVVGAPQMISQSVSSIFPSFLLPSGIWRTPGLMLSSHLFLCLPCLLSPFIDSAINITDIHSSLLKLFFFKVYNCKYTTDPKHKRLKKCFLMDETGQNVQSFKEVLFSPAMYNTKTEKQSINSTYLVSVRCSEAGGTKRAKA